MPDRSFKVSVSFTTNLIIDEESLKARTGHTNPTAIQLNAAFASWKSEQLEAVKRNFKTGNLLSDEADITVRETT